MAYGNWGAFVFKEGIRMNGHEDADTGLPSGHALDLCHAVLGDGRVKLCGYKSIPVLLVDNAQVDLQSFTIDATRPGDFAGLIGDYRFRVTRHGSNYIDLFLREPDGSVWTATCGFEYGAGWMDRE